MDGRLRITGGDLDPASPAAVARHHLKVALDPGARIVEPTRLTKPDPLLAGADIAGQSPRAGGRHPPALPDLTRRGALR